MKLLILDNYDSFTYNVFHYCEQFVDDIDVVRNDQIELNDVSSYDAIILSPGPGLPKDAGIMPELIKTYSKDKKILGICLGMQGIAESFGGSLINLTPVLHGEESQNHILHKDEIFNGIESPFQIGHYHSWAVNPEDLPSELEVTSKNENDIIMSLRHKEYNLRGIQFHPESIMTNSGLKIIENWIKL